MSAVVELSESSKSSLLIEFNFSRLDNWIEKNNRSITPKDIASCIINALKLGWQPSVNAGVFTYKYGTEPYKFKNENASKLARTPHKTRRPF